MCSCRNAQLLYHPLPLLCCPSALLTLTIVVSPIAVAVPPVTVLPLAIVLPITVVKCVVCRVSKKYLYRKKIIMGAQLLLIDRRQ